MMKHKTWIIQYRDKHRPNGSWYRSNRYPGRYTYDIARELLLQASTNNDYTYRAFNLATANIRESWS